MFVLKETRRCAEYFCFMDVVLTGKTSEDKYPHFLSLWPHFHPHVYSHPFHLFSGPFCQSCVGISRNCIILYNTLYISLVTLSKTKKKKKNFFVLYVFLRVHLNVFNLFSTFKCMCVVSVPEREKKFKKTRLMSHNSVHFGRKASSSGTN